MPVKTGAKKDLESSLDGEMPIALSITIPVVLLARMNLWLALIVLPVFPYLIIRRRNAVKTYCEYIVSI